MDTTLVAIVAIAITPTARPLVLVQKTKTLKGEANMSITMIILIVSAAILLLYFGSHRAR